MFDGFREKVHSVQENFSSRILNVAEGTLVKKPDMKHAEAGANMLHKVLNQWNELHTLSEENALRAQVVDEKVGAICKHTNKQLSQMVQLCFSLNQLPKLVDRAQAVIHQTDSLERQFKDLENSLYHLEEIIHIQKVQENQLEKRFKLAMHKENKLKHLEALRGSMERNYNEKVKSIEEKKAILSQERQKTFEEAFKQDLEIYKQSGNLNIITSSKVNNCDNLALSLDEVVLDVDNSELNKMLSSS